MLGLPPAAQSMPQIFVGPPPAAQIFSLNFSFADFVSCEVFWSLYVPEGVGDIGANSNKQYAEDLTAWSEDD